jgi:hypothetical protein
MSIFCRVEKSGANLSRPLEMAIIKCQPRPAATAVKQNADGRARTKIFRSEQNFPRNC